jgi:hypothetical protein
MAVTAMGTRGNALLILPIAVHIPKNMPTSNTNDLLVDAQKILDTWKANTSFNIGSKITLDSFTKDRDQLTALDTAIESRRIELQGLINERNDLSNTCERKSPASAVASTQSMGPTLRNTTKPLPPAAANARRELRESPRWRQRSNRE